MVGLLCTGLGLALTGIPALLVPALLKIPGRAAFAAAALVVAAGDVVGTILVLSPPRLVTRPDVLALQAVIAAASALLWVRCGRPPWPALGRRVPLSRPGWAWALPATAAVVMLVQLYVDIRVAPSNWDSMTYHLSRAAYWLQQHAALHYPGGSIRQLGSAPNAEIIVAWQMLLTGTDRWVELVQWIALGGLAVTIFSGARLLGFGIRAAGFAGALFCLLPQPVMQSTTTQNDVVTSFFVAASALFTARGMRDRHFGHLAIAGAALGLAIGTKGTALLALPSLGLLAAGACIGWRPPWRVIAGGAGLAVAGIVAFGAFNYVLNYKNSHDPLGGVTDQVSRTGGDRSRNAAHALWSFADAPGVTIVSLQPLVESPVKAAFGGTFGPAFPYAIDTNVQEDTVAYGLVGFLLLVPLLLVVLLAPRSRMSRRLLAAAALLFLLVFSYRIDDNPWLGRVYMPGVALAAPLLAAFGRRPMTAGIVSTMALMSTIPCVLQNPQKQLLVGEGASNVFSLDRLHQMSQLRPDMAEVIEQVFRFSGGPHSRLGYVGGEDSWDYPLFGAHREHHVERMTSGAAATYRLMRRDRLAGIFFANVGIPHAPLKYVRLGDDYWWVPAHPLPGQQAAHGREMRAPG